MEKEKSTQILKILRDRREKMGLSREEVAQTLFIDQGTYRDIETGKIRLSLENFLLICKKLEVDPIELVKNSNQVIISVTKEEAETFNNMNKKIQSGFNIENIKTETKGNVIIGTNIKSKKDNKK